MPPSGGTHNVKVLPLIDLLCHGDDEGTCCQEYVDNVPRAMTKDEAFSILEELGVNTDGRNPKKDLDKMATWERFIQLRKDAPLRACHFPFHSAVPLGSDKFSV
jgi:hypothetical protein